MAHDKSSAMLNSTAHKQHDVSCGEVAVHEPATVDGATIQEAPMAAHEDSPEGEIENIQQKTIIKPGTFSLDIASGGPIVCSLGTTLAGHTIVSDTASGATLACDAVYDTPELPEAIISFLPSLDILSNARRVSRTWKNAIAQSPAIQTRLWLKSQSGEVLAPAGYTTTYPWTKTTPIVGARRSLFRDGVNYPVYPVDLMHNSIVPDDKFRLDKPPGIHPDDSTKRIPKIHSAFFALPKNTPSDARPSRLDMYLTERRITTVHLDILVPTEPMHADSCISNMLCYGYSMAAVQDPKGLTLGAVLAVVQKVRDCMPASITNRDDALASIRFVKE